MDIVDGIDLSDKVCVITGATSGLGKESARALAFAGAHVVLAARSRDGLTAAQDWIHGVVDDARTSTAIVDLASLASVRRAAAAIADFLPAVHILMNNAGVMFTPFGRTADGFEMAVRNKSSRTFRADPSACAATRGRRRRPGRQPVV
jgi:NAD(P)-dependent dehydrogenase (short-subunit alcohol dehydrogenase family)